MKFDIFADTPAAHAAHLPHAVIIGGRASGVLLAAHLLRDPDAPLRVTVIEGRQCWAVVSSIPPAIRAIC